MDCKGPLLQALLGMDEKWDSEVRSELFKGTKQAVDVPRSVVGWWVNASVTYWELGLMPNCPHEGFVGFTVLGFHGHIWYLPVPNPPLPWNICSWKPHYNEGLLFQLNYSHQLLKWVVDSNVLFRRVRLLVIREQTLKIVPDFSLLPSTSALGLLIDEVSHAILKAI